MPLIRIYLVDDSPAFIDAAIRYLSLLSNIQVVGFSLSGQQALENLPGTGADLVLIDLAMPGLNGLETTRRIKAQQPAPRVIILTLYDNPEYRQACQAVGADGFISKSDFGADLLPQVVELFEQSSLPSTS